MKLNRNSKSAKENGQRVIGINSKHCKMNIYKNLRYQTECMIIFIELMIKLRMKKQYQIKLSHMSRVSLCMKNKNYNLNKKNYRNSKICIMRVKIKKMKIINKIIKIKNN